MTAASRIVRQRASEEGAVAVTVALMLPVMIVFLALVLVAGQWFVHKRHLQTQADAAALAAASEFTFPCDSSVVARMHTAVAEYGGGTHNPQVEDGQPNVRLLLNSPTYDGETDADDTPAGSPCQTNMVDVKARETGIANLMGVVGVSPTIHAHARVELFRVDQLSGLRPIGVPDPTPRRARAYFVDEATGAAIAETPLTRGGTDDNGYPVWDNAGSPVTVQVATRSRIGVRIALGGATSTECGAPLVECYDSGSANGLSFIQGWSADGSGAQPAAPKVRSVNLFSSSCQDPYFSRNDATCTIGVRAAVDFGTGYGQSASADPRTATMRASLAAIVGGDTYPLAYNDAGPDRGTWTSDEEIEVQPGAGPIPVSLRWEEQGGIVGANVCSDRNNNRCTGTFANVQRSFAGDEVRSGPIQLVQVLENNIAGVNTVQQCGLSNATCARDLVVSVSIRGTMRPAQSADEAPVPLRIGDQNQTQALDCDPALSTLRDELAQGCSATYGINDGVACPNRSTLWGTNQPWRCIALSTGAQTNQVAAGLNERILGSDQPTACTHPNRFRVDFGDFDPDDPRILQLAISPYGSFSGTGNDTTVPITNFATFYITGWRGSGGGFANPCETNDVPADPDLRDDVPASASYVLGHFISYKTANGIPSGTHCDSSTVTPCVSVMTR